MPERICAIGRDGDAWARVLTAMGTSIPVCRPSGAFALQRRALKGVIGGATRPRGDAVRGSCKPAVRPHADRSLPVGGWLPAHTDRGGAPTLQRKHHRSPRGAILILEPATCLTWSTVGWMSSRSDSSAAATLALSVEPSHSPSASFSYSVE